MSSCVRLRQRATVFTCVCTRMWCSARSTVCCRVHVTWFLCPGRCAGLLQRRTQRLPALRGSNQRVATPDTYFRPPGRPCRKESQTVSLIPFRILWIASAVGCQSTHARLRSPRLLQGNQPPCLQKPLEPETAQGNQPPCVYRSSWNPRLRRATSPLASTKAAQKLDHLGQPVPQQSRSPRLSK